MVDPFRFWIRASHLNELFEVFLKPVGRNMSCSRVEGKTGKIWMPSLTLRWTKILKFLRSVFLLISVVKILIDLAILWWEEKCVA